MTLHAIIAAVILYKEIFFVSLERQLADWDGENKK